MSEKMTYQIIKSAIDTELNIWRENQKDAISSFDLASEIPIFNTMPDIFKAATWFGLGMTAAEKLTPLTATTTLVSRTAGPLAILKLASDYFAKEYTQQMNANRLQLETNARNYTNRLRDTIDQASRDFYNPGVYGSLLINKLLALSDNDVFSRPKDIGYLLADSRTNMHTVVHQAGDKFDYIDSDVVLNDVLLNAWRYEAKHEEGGFLRGIGVKRNRKGIEKE